MKQLMIIFLLKSALFGDILHFANANALSGDKIKPISAHEFSSVACLLRNTSDNMISIFCTATFFTTAYLLTAAGCLHLFESEGFYVQAGSHDVRYGASFTPLWWTTFEQYIVKYNKTKLHEHNDIGVIKLQFPAACVTPSPLSQLGPTQLVGKKVKIIGCSPCYADPAQPTTIKEKTHVKILSNDECLGKARKIREQEWIIPEYVLCTRSKPHSLTNDPDYGGPLLLNGELLAVTLGLMCFEESTPDRKKINLHLSIRDYMEFITFSMQIE